MATIGHRVAYTAMIYIYWMDHISKKWLIETYWFLVMIWFISQNAIFDRFLSKQSTLVLCKYDLTLNNVQIKTSSQPLKAYIFRINDSFALVLTLKNQHFEFFPPSGTPCAAQQAPIKTRRPRPPSLVASHQHSAQPGGIPTGLGLNKCVWLCSKLLAPRGTDAVYKYLPRNRSADLLFR